MSDFVESFKDGRRDPWNFAFSLTVLVVSFVFYFLTVQRTVPFWDCGEFITCAYILGVPHPPGTPLFVLIGSVFSHIPIGDDPSFRINLISSISSAFAAMLGYLVVVWLIRRWFAGRDIDGWRRVTVYLGGLVGGFYFAFGRTNWGNSVEAEVYGTSMLFMMATMYLMLLWVDNRKNQRGEAFLVLMAYLATLALGVHMTSYIVVPFAFLLIIFVDEEYRRSWQIWVTFAIMLLIVYEVGPFFVAASTWLTVACIAYYWRRMSAGWIYTGAIPLVAMVLLLMQGKPLVPVYSLSLFGWCLVTLLVHRLDSSERFWRIGFLVMLVALLGFSSQIFIPIRAAQKPAMNMNSPDNWEAFKGFLERKQYGSESMITRMLHRRGEWVNQFGRHRRMGFWGFFEDQYGINGSKFLILFFFGLYGSYYSIRKHWKSGIFVFLIMLAGTVGLVLYMNFADGTREHREIGEGHLEVRDRDYFWTPGFVMFGLLIGIGIAAFFDMLRQALSGPRASPSLRNAVLGVACCACCYFPYKAIDMNYFVSDRSRNFIPYDYAWNILQSAREDAVLFTNGDNDTFPVWCLQHVYGIRPDVKIANLSLINTHWYVKQLKNELGVPISFTEEQIETLGHRRKADGGIYRVQDQMIVDIIETNKFELPIEFAVTVSQSNKVYRDRPLDEYLQMEGMSLLLYPSRQPDAIDIDKTHDLYWNVFKYRGVNDPTVYKDENASRLVNNYISGFIMVADTLQKLGRVDEAAAEIYKAIELIGGGMEPWAYLCRMYAMHGRLEDAERVRREAPDTIQKAELGLFIASALAEKGHSDKAKSYFEEAYEVLPDSRDVFNELFRFYYREKMQDELVELLRDWSTRHPEDTRIKQAYEQLMREVPQPAPDGNSRPDSVPAEQERYDSGVGN